MKKFILAAATLLVATLSIGGSAHADGRYGDDDEWRRNRHHQEDRDQDRDRETGFRNRHHDGDRGRLDDGWRYGGWHGEGRERWRSEHWQHERWQNRHLRPRIYVEPRWAHDCFTKKVRRYDAWGNLYIKRVRICR